MPVTFIGDVHGWCGRLDRLLAQLRPPLVFLGDLVDRGADSREVIRTVRGLCDAGLARCILGNHEWALCRGLGVVGGSADTRLFDRWSLGWGGDAVLRSYGARDAAYLRRAMGEDADWLASLPWVLTDETDGIPWCAVHAGLFQDLPYAQQVARLERGFAEPLPPWEPLPPHLFSKQLLTTRPTDAPAGLCVVSGHTPLVQVLATPERILCDTSGGLANRPLSAVTLPGLRVTAAE